MGGMPDTDRTDLQRLRDAFTELSARGFGADFQVARTAFTKQDAAAETPPGPKGLVYGYAQAYAAAFFAEDGYGVAAQPLPADIRDEIEAMKPELLGPAGIDPDEHADALEELARGEIDEDDVADDYVALEEAWRELPGNTERAEAALAHERENRWHTLLAPLVLGWHSPEHLGEIVETLSSHGLRVTPPPDESVVILVESAGTDRAERRGAYPGV
jgi:hypothetical protein